MDDAENKEVTEAFRPRARLLQLLGDQLIGSPRLAIFELVKNAWDADASRVEITFEGLGTDKPKIIVEDNGRGMTLETITDIWLVPGDDHREQERRKRVRSPKFHRLPLGEKGVGRFAVHKLGDYIELTSRAEDSKECFTIVDWELLLQSRFLSDSKVTASERAPKTFADRTGTRIEISRLRPPEWTRGEIRDLYRQVTSIVSPFGDPADNFEIVMKVVGHPDWIDSMPPVAQLLDMAPYLFEFDFDGHRIHYRYEFRGIPGLKLGSREIERDEFHFQIPPGEEPDDFDSADGPRPKRPRRVTADKETLEGIGPVSGRFRIFDRDKVVLSLYGDTRLLERYLNQNGGVRVYRDGVRVYNYGERSDDWLGLDLKRVNDPAKRLSRNITIGTVDLQLAASSGLQEKTNREGFVETEAYRRLTRVVLGALWILQVERNIDKQRIREVTGEAPDVPGDFEGPLAELRKLAREHNLEYALEPAIGRIEFEYNTLRENFARSGVSHAGLAVIFHEVERGVRVLTGAINAPDAKIEYLKDMAGQLQGLLETSTQLLRNSDAKPNSLKATIRTARDLSLIRFRLHGIKLTCPALEQSTPDAQPTFAAGLVLGALTNLLDNAVHWLKVRHSDSAERRLYVNVNLDYDGGPAIIVADNGTGLIDSPSTVVAPFFTRRPDGIGLGLFFANLVMDLSEGRLEFPTADQAGVPDAFDGAIVALVFKGG